MRRLGSGWAIFSEAQRQPAHQYPACEFPDATSRLVDAEREDFLTHGGGFGRFHLTNWLGYTARVLDGDMTISWRLCDWTTPVR